jgi:MFS family permease
MSAMNLLRRPAYVRFWVADTVSMFGTHVTTLALQVLAVVTLQASATWVGVLNASRWVPYLLFGLVAGVLVDRYRRRPVLVGADLARAALLGLIPLLAALDRLTMPVLVAVVGVFGALSLLYDAAHQSYLPRLVPRELLTRANARMEQAAAVAQTTGPMLAGFMVKAFGAPLAILVDAASYLVSGLVLARLRVDEPAPGPPEQRDLRRELREGLAWVYRHRTLGPLALNSHAWFLFNSMVTTVYVVFVVDGLGMNAFALGVTYACAGVGSLLGASAAGRAARLVGAGPAIIAMRWLLPFGYAMVPLAGRGTGGLVLLCAAQFVFGVTIGVDSPIEMGYRQAVTPDHLQGRMNATMRSLNRGAVVVGAPLGGVLADHLGALPALWIPVAGLAAVALWLTLSPFRLLRGPLGDHQPLESSA